MKRDLIEKIRAALQETGIDAWGLYSFRQSNPVACATVGLRSEDHVSRRWFSVIPREGQPVSLIHRIEPHLESILPGRAVWYSSYDEYVTKLEELLAGIPTIAMEYSAKNEIPVVSWVDAGTVELVRSLGAEVLSSGELVSRVSGRLEPAQVASAKRSGSLCRAIMMRAFDVVRIALIQGRPISELDVVRYIELELERNGLETPYPPICAFGPNSANPHYSPTESNARTIDPDGLLLIDLWGKEKGFDGVFGDITWVAWTGSEVPERVSDVFAVVRAAREAALGRLLERYSENRVPTGAELDRAARDVIETAGFGEYFVHRTGHSITDELHGPGTNLDSLESNDERPIIFSSSFSIEPGVYLEGEFGIRSEVDVVVDHDGTVEVTSEPAQVEVLPLLGQGFES